MVNLTAEERKYLETLVRARTIQAQTVSRARILLLKADGCSIDDIADKVGINRKSVMLCLRKYAEGAMINAELAAFASHIEQLVKENALAAIDQDIYGKRYNELAGEYETLHRKREAVERHY